MPSRYFWAVGAYCRLEDREILEPRSPSPGPYTAYVKGYPRDEYHRLYMRERRWQGEEHLRWRSRGMSAAEAALERRQLDMLVAQSRVPAYAFQRLKGAKWRWSRKGGKYLLEKEEA